MRRANSYSLLPLFFTHSASSSFSSFLTSFLPYFLLSPSLPHHALLHSPPCPVIFCLFSCSFFSPDTFFTLFFYSLSSTFIFPHTFFFIVLPTSTFFFKLLSLGIESYELVISVRQKVKTVQTALLKSILCVLVYFKVNCHVYGMRWYIYIFFCSHQTLLKFTFGLYIHFGVKR